MKFLDQQNSNGTQIARGLWKLKILRAENPRASQIVVRISSTHTFPHQGLVERCERR